MRKFIFLLVCTISFGQQHGKVAQTITHFQNQNQFFERKSLFTPATSGSSQHTSVLSKVSYTTLNETQLGEIITKQPELLEIDVPYENGVISLLLYKVRLHAGNFHIDTDKAQNLDAGNGTFYRGIIKGDEKSLVSFNFFADQANGIISSETLGNLTVAKLYTANPGRSYIVYSDRDLLVSNGLGCNTPQFMPETFTEVQEQSSLTLNCVTIYFEIDYDLYVANGSDLTQTTTWINSVYNNVQTLYDNDNINTALKSVFIWTSPDPYSGGNIYQYLNSFHANRPVFDGDVGQLLTTGTGLGGVAATVNGLCSANNYLYSDINLAFGEVPNFSWTVQSITHELGHIMGSPHTHDCVWNGNNTPIDGCGPSIGYPGLTEQNTTCNLTAPNPTNGGTIMSYCYAVNGVGNNFANGFGEQPAARIAQTVDAVNCLGTDCINSCIPSLTALTIGVVSPNSVSVTWTDANPGNTSWQVSAAAYPFVPSAWSTVNSQTSYTFDGLTPNTYYKFFVRNNCGELAGTPLSSNYVATIDFYCNAVSFTDTGGSQHNYSDYQDWTRTLFPIAVSNATVKVTFSSIDIENGYDFLHVYDGPDTNSPELITGGITGNAVTGPFTSTHPSGALTFRFISDTNTNGAGWDAIVSCETLGINENDPGSFSYSPNPVYDKLNVLSKIAVNHVAVFSIDGKLLYQSDRLDNGQIDFSKFARGAYIVKLQSESKSVVFKIIRK